MVVNPFWFGVLMTIVFEVVLAIIVTLIASHRVDDEDDVELTNEEIKEVMERAIREATEEALRKSQYGHGVEDRDDG